MKMPTMRLARRSNPSPAVSVVPYPYAQHTTRATKRKADEGTGVSADDLVGLKEEGRGMGRLLGGEGAGKGVARSRSLIVNEGPRHRPFTGGPLPDSNVR